MRVFVTGATGFVASAIVPELINRGHQVLGSLARMRAPSPLPRQALKYIAVHWKISKACAAEPPARMASFTRASSTNFSKFAENCEIDKRAIEAIGSVLEGCERPLLVTSGLMTVAAGHRIATEQDPAPPVSASYPRASEATAEVMAKRGVRASIVRLSASVHGDGDHGFVPNLIRMAREKGVSAYVGDGLNRWPGVHRLDAAVVYRLALEKSAAGVRYHAVADEGITLREIATVIGRWLNVPVVSKTPEEAKEHFGWFAHFVAADIPGASQWTRDNLGWQPKQPGLISDIDWPGYFEIK